MNWRLWIGAMMVLSFPIAGYISNETISPIPFALIAFGGLFLMFTAEDEPNKDERRMDTI